MNRPLALLGHLAILVLAYHITSSVSGFLLTGLGLVFLADKYLVRWLSWPPLVWRRELATRGGAFLAGAVTFYLLRPGLVPLREAVYRGFMVCLAGLVLERVWRATGRPRPVLLLVVLVVLTPWLVVLHPLHTVPKRTPVALGLAFEDVRFPSRDGTRLAAWLMPHPAARGNVIYCHGHGLSRGQGAGVFKTLHGGGLNILAFDFRGHGDSAGHTSTFGDREVDDLLAAVRYLRARFPDQPLFLMGVSLGAAVVLQALPQIPDVCGVWSEAGFSRLAHTVEHQFAQLPGLVRRPLVRGYYVLGWLDCGLWVPSINPVDNLDGLAVPIFFCHGRDDQLVPCAEALELFDTYTGPKWNWWVDGADHHNIRQRAPNEYRRRLKKYLEDRLKSARGERIAASD